MGSELNGNLAKSVQDFIDLVAEEIRRRSGNEVEKRNAHNGLTKAQLVAEESVMRSLDGISDIELKPKRNGHARKPVDMKCRAPRCKQRSKGPRYSFMCPKHIGR